MTALPATILSILLVSAIALVGILLFTLRREWIEHILLYLISFSAGALLGDVFLHIIPEMTEEAGFTLDASMYILGGIVVSFIIEKIIHWRHCHVLPHEQHYHPVGILNLIGDGAHNIIDGILIAGSFLVSIPLGIATTTAVALHEIPQEISDTALLLYSGFTRRSAILFNLLSAAGALLGGLIVLALPFDAKAVASMLLPLAAGNFLYIAGADLIPELHKEVDVRHSLLQLLCICAGIGFMWWLTLLK